MPLHLQSVPRGRLLVALFVSLCLHFALLTSFEGAPGTTVSQPGSALGIRTVQFRLLQAPPRPETTESPAPPEQESADTQTESKAPTLLAEAPYYAPKDLTSRPTLLSEGHAPPPTHIPDIYPLPVLVYLYINESGSVDAVVLGESFLSDTAKKFIQDTFTAMTFTPGMLGTYPVKSRLTLEVKLDAILSPH